MDPPPSGLCRAESGRPPSEPPLHELNFEWQTTVCKDPSGPVLLPRLAQVRPRLAHTGPSRNRPNSVEVGTNLTKIGQVFSISVPIWTKLAKLVDLGPSLADNGQNGPDSARSWPKSPQLYPTSVQFWSNSSRPQIWPDRSQMLSTTTDGLKSSARVLRHQGKTRRARSPLRGSVFDDVPSGLLPVRV